MSDYNYYQSSAYAKERGIFYAIGRFLTQKLKMPRNIPYHQLDGSWCGSVKTGYKEIGWDSDFVAGKQCPANKNINKKPSVNITKYLK